jgi:hypothetical protein
MNTDWAYVKKATLWHYEELLKKLNAVLAYPIIRQAYNHTMPQAADYARGLFPDKNILAGEYPAEIIVTLKRLEAAGVRDCSDLLRKVATREACSTFVENQSLGFREVILLVHRADIACLPYVRRKTILPVCGAGYDTLDKIATAHLNQMEADMEHFYQRTQGKSWDDFISVILLRCLVIGAQALPKIVISSS